MSRSPSLQSQWLTLLAADAGLAAANRDRFPSISLSASVDQNIDWNLMASLTQPLFNAGKLAAAEDQAEANVQQQEKLYLKAVFSTFADVENALMQETTLEHRYAIANDNLATARQSTALALNQYQLGLTELDALLSIQKSMIDTEAQVIRLQNQRLANRISLYQLLGGDTRPVVSRDIPKPSDAL
ncbi:TolC family protein [Oceanospirillum sp. HFRX-1_2]